MKHSLKSALCAGLLAISTLSAAPQAAAQQCGGNNMAAELLKKHQAKLTALGCKSDTDCAEKRADLIKNLVDVWNQLAGNSPLTIGPRRLDLGTTLGGAVVNPGERRFISLPIVGHDKVKLKITKKGGQAETEIVVSKLDASGRCSEVARETVPAGTGSYTKTLNLSSVRGAVLIVRLTPKDLLRKLEYTLRADGQ